MGASMEEWKAQLVGLPHDERAELVQFLMGTLEPEDGEIEAAWDAEASRRVAEIRAGRAKGRPIEDLLNDLREQYP